MLKRLLYLRKGMNNPSKQDIMDVRRLIDLAKEKFNLQTNRYSVAI